MTASGTQQGVLTDRLRREQVGRRRGLVAGSGEIDVLRRPCPIAEAVVERQAALQHPSVGGHGDKAGEQSIEGDLLAQPDDGAARVTGLRGKARLEGPTEGACVGVPHCGDPASAASIKR